MDCVLHPGCSQGLSNPQISAFSPFLHFFSPERSTRSADIEKIRRPVAVVRVARQVRTLQGKRRITFRAEGFLVPGLGSGGETLLLFCSVSATSVKKGHVHAQRSPLVTHFYVAPYAAWQSKREGRSVPDFPAVHQSSELNVESVRGNRLASESCLLRMVAA